MSVSLEKIDQVRERTHSTYEAAKRALENCNDDVVEAIIYLEKEQKTNPDRPIAKEASHLFDQVKKLVKSGNENKFVVEKDANTVLSVPVNAAIVTAVIVPPIAAIGAAAALFTKHSIKVEKPNNADLR